MIQMFQQAVNTTSLKKGLSKLLLAWVTKSDMELPVDQSICKWFQILTLKLQLNNSSPWFLLSAKGITYNELHPPCASVSFQPYPLCSIFYIFQKVAPWSFRSFRECLFLHINNTMVILLKTVSVQVSSIQIIQVRVQNKGKSVWKSRYDGDISTPPSLNLCLYSSNSVDKLKVIKKNFYKLCLLLLL